MASWCGICRRKLKANYIYYKGVKIHKKCRALALKRDFKGEKKR